VTDPGPLRFGLLGPLQVVRGDEAVTIGASKQRALLTLLLLRAGEAVPADVLIEELWPSDRPENAPNALQWHVARLRRVLEPAGSPQAIETRAGGYAVRVAPDALDVHRFERLMGEAASALGAADAEAAAAASRQALALWRGAPLADVTYEPFAQMPVARLEELRLAAVELRIRADLALGRHGTVIPELRELVAAHPTREALAAALMLALYRAGRQAEALEVYQRTRRHLDDELGLEPGVELQRLERAVLAQDPALELPAPPSDGTDDAARQAMAMPSTARTRAILVVAAKPADVEPLLAVAEPLARSAQRHELIVTRLLTPEHGTGLGEAVRDLAAARSGLVERGVDVRVAAFTSDDPSTDVVRSATEQDVDLVLIACPPGVAAGEPFRADVARVLREAPADVALLALPASPRAPAAGASAIVTPFAGDAHDWASLELAAWLAGATGAALRLAGSAADPERGRRDASRLLAVASLAVQSLAGVLAEPVIIEATPAALVRELEHASLAVLALPAAWPERGLGTFRAAVLGAAPVPVLLVRSGLRPGGLSPPDGLTRYSWSLAGGAR
jgi:DNA-binding SARP family transcriptional activator